MTGLLSQGPWNARVGVAESEICESSPLGPNPSRPNILFLIVNVALDQSILICFTEAHQTASISGERIFNLRGQTSDASEQVAADS